jgi:hypothetical protein
MTLVLRNKTGSQGDSPGLELKAENFRVKMKCRRSFLTPISKFGILRRSVLIAVGFSKLSGACGERPGEALTKKGRMSDRPVREKVYLREKWDRGRGKFELHCFSASGTYKGNFF